MTNKAKKYWIGLICAIVAMFLWIFVAVVLTGGRDVGEFTETDKVIMTVFAVVEIATVILTLLLAVLAGRERGKQLRQQAEENGQPAKGGAWLWVFAVLAAFGAQLGGILLGKGLDHQLRQLSGYALWGSIAVAAVGLLLNFLLGKWYIQRFNKQQIRQVNAFVYSHRERAAETAAKKLSLLKAWRVLAGVYALLLGLLGLCVALCSGIGYDSGSSTMLCFAASLLLVCAFSRIRRPLSPKIFDEDKSYVSREQYPHLYAVAQKAADTMDCTGEIRIALLPDCNAGIAKLGKICSVQLGVVLLGTLSEEELYSILLHEFAHVTEENAEELKARSYADWLQSGKLPHYASAITDRFYDFFDVFYMMHCSLYLYAASVLLEAAADQAMLLGGNPVATGSALLKLKYHELFNWEKGTRDEPCVYQPEEPEARIMTRELEAFLQAMEHRSQDWQHLLNVEIQSRASTHPTLKQRLEALGIQEPRTIAPAADSDYARDCKKALEHVDKMLCDDLKEMYEDLRKTYYLEPKEQVEQWEAAGKPLVAEEYSDIVWALRQLGRNRSAIALCQRAIEELPDAAACNGYFIRGCHRLHSYDQAGIADIYFAIETNSNYLDEGIDAIGAFCCLTGNQAELDIYREKGMELAQKQKDQYSQVGVLTKKDRLSQEHLPEGMLEDILAYIRSVDEGQIEKLYLVRKIITEDFFTSVFVVRFALEANQEECDKIMHKIFQYLDTSSDWQFSLFDYQDVMNVPVWEVPGSCVYEKTERNTP